MLSAKHGYISMSVLPVLFTAVLMKLWYCDTIESIVNNLGDQFVILIVNNLIPYHTVNYVSARSIVGKV